MGARQSTEDGSRESERRWLLDVGTRRTAVVCRFGRVRGIPSCCWGESRFNTPDISIISILVVVFWHSFVQWDGMTAAFMIGCFLKIPQSGGEGMCMP